MNTKQLKQKILSLAISGKLVPQDPSDEPASELLKRIKAERESTVEKGRKKKATTDTSHYQQCPPFQLPQGWVWFKLGEIGKWRAGITPSRGRKDYYGGNIPWLKTGDLTDDYIYEVSEYITEKALEETSIKLNPKGSILIAMYGATIGKVGILTFESATNQACCACTEYENIVAQKYLFYFLLSHKKNFVMIGGGGAQPNISKEKIVETFIPLPPLKEQERIVQEVDRLFALIYQLEEDKTALQQLVTQLKSKILSLAIRGQLVPQDANDTPAEELLKQINPAYKSSGNLHYQPFEIPKSWVWVEHQIILGISGGAQPSKSYFSEEKSPNYVRLYQIRDYGDKPMPVYIPKELANKLTQKGDILLARYGGSLGKVFIAEEGAYNVAMAKIVFKFEGLIDKDFAYYYYLSEIYQDKLKSISRTAQAGFNSTDLSDMLFVLPPYNEQKRIAKRITELFNIIDEIQNALNS